MLVLVDARTGRIVEKHKNKTLLEFLKNEWAGWYPYYMDGRLHTTYGPHGSFFGCFDESKYWAEHDDLGRLRLETITAAGAMLVFRGPMEITLRF